MSTVEVSKAPEKSHDDVKENAIPESAASGPASASVEQAGNQSEKSRPISEEISPSPPPSSVVEPTPTSTTKETLGKNEQMSSPTIICEDPAPGSPPSTSRSSKSPAVKERSPAPSPAPVPPARTKKRKDWQPLEPPVAEAIEAHHLQYFRGQTIPEGLTVFSAKEASNKPQLTELQLEGMEIRWSSVIDVSLSFKRGAILRYIGWGKSQALRRGFHKEAEWDDGPAEISHLILVVHGIGQKGYENLIAENAQQVREAVVSAIERCYPEEKGRPMFLPVEWRSILKLDDGVTDVITLPKMSSMRNVLNSTAMDIMYYQSPLYRREIISGVVRQLNRIYTLFTENNPSFSGPVSIFAHSLGSVIIYDILLRWSPFLLYDKYVTHAMDTHLEECTDPENREALKAFQKARDVLYEKIDGGVAPWMEPIRPASEP
nr:CBN-IPLA-1 protein [Haemonchus contortus]